jgi:hypothetical protein
VIVPDFTRVPVQCVDCGLVLDPFAVMELPYGDTVVGPLCAAHYQRRIDTIEGNP